jgi:hypothetical protein
MARSDQRQWCPPAPPIALLELGTVWPGEILYNVHHWNSISPTFKVACYPHQNRFDPMPSPWHETKALYACTTLDAALHETVMRWRQMLDGPYIVDTFSQLATRRVTMLSPRRPLKVVEASGLAVKRIDAVLGDMARAFGRLPTQRAEGIFGCSDCEFTTSQAWGAWLRSQSPEADGFRWSSLHRRSAMCVVLFGDRCSDDVQAVAPAHKVAHRDMLKAVDRLLGSVGWARHE